ncbi:MAG: succinate dehydrogenase cytochrome b subunit [Corynebacterium sp.]|uniref:succinate dehydrogenase cytochrome b subunit n=1 Tax=unclassified Corynebacterium TaxID=2624378 RepID=UPI0026485858|nr:succinate dehydrogenase cytochrome b subunit [Corynebacterium sp.]MDN5581190.1 succinate dehydrogenase cytochrome b subunit [Corynebacterium sp.]MDN5720289.1 succinate dehydrogenase cytochrome b subunit [Corynebacterium sp.]MDN6258840.1 succinate dehydrogenase cytochrome b subunit [Corynebacterium sp.]MDN6511001.1 succinate dehydrogenase cytochrome b subunit [Corynebacterium sp.]
MTVKYDDPAAIEHGKISIKPLREKPGFPSWAMKLTMAVTGIIFGLFVLVHMVGNLKVYTGADHFNEYAHFLREVGEPLIPREGLLWIARVVLLVALVLHVWCAFALKKRSRESRGAFKRTGKVGGLNTFTASSMLGTGMVLLLFIIFHILDLTIGAEPAASNVFEHGEAYANLVASFERPVVAIFYILCMLVLFLHLSHGIWTASSDLGITGHRTRQVMLWIAYLLPAVVMIGNISIPLMVMFGVVS